MNLTKPQKLIYDMEKYAGGAISVICGGMLIRGKKGTTEIQAAVNELYRLNDALRIRISETDGTVSQKIMEYAEQNIPVLRFESKAEMDSYAEKYVKTPLDFYGNLCEISVVVLPEQYGLLVKLHHIIGDAWSLSLLGTQFNKLLNGDFFEAYSYADYVQTEEKYIQSKRYERDKNFFVEQFKKCDEATYINEKQSDSLNAKRKTFAIDNAHANLINSFAEKNETSAFMLFTVALSAYMNRTKMNAEKFYIGTAVLNRSGNKEQNTVGMFINTVPMLIELDNEKSFSENLSSVEETALSVFRHERYNYGDVLTNLRKEFNFGEKLYDTMISYQNAKVGGADVETTWYHGGEQSESLQIHIDDRDSEGIFRVHYDYLTEKFTGDEIEKIHRHICNLLFDGIANPNKKLHELNILTPEEQQKLLYTFNDTAVEYPKDKCVHQLFEEQVERTPDKTAIVACDKTLTYRELNEEANKIAHSLIEKGIGVGDIVAFMLLRKSYMISTILGILKSGAAYLPIDPDYPQDRIDYMLSDSNAKILITENDIEDLLDNSKTFNPCVSMSSESLCYCIYTSGSTGRPKGTLLTHSNVANYVNNNNNNVVHKIIKSLYNSIVSVTTVGFDIFVTESLLPLVNGMEIVLANEEQSKTQAKLNALLKLTPADVIQTTPTKLKALIANDRELDYIKNIKTIILGGEALDVLLIEDLKKITNADIFNIYGPTETTVWATNAKIEDNITIGKPIANTQIYIVDKYMQITPIGVIGELCIAGDGVGAGYLNRPELTAEKFIDNPFGKGKLYKTGDLAYWREDGNIAYVGRNDFQVKIRGLRIELGEIENAINSVDGISQSVVVVRKDEAGRQLICAFYTGEEKPAKEIRDTIGKRLPKYMLPHIFTHIVEMPLTSSGKVNRKALPEIDLENIETTVEFVEPKNEAERNLVDSVKAVLNCEKVSTLDNFFDVGGDSLKAIELVSQLESRGYEVQVKTIFEFGTIQELAKKLSVAEKGRENFDYSGDIPATDAQKRVYTAQSMNSDSTMYNVPYAFEVEDVNIDRLQNAVNKLIARHESLRTHFENKDGKIIQIIDETADCRVERLKSDDIADFIRPFDLSKSPLLRIGAYGNIVMTDMHHIITDGGSMPVFFKELNELYMGRELENMAVQYKQFAVQKQDHSESEKYWLSVYGDELPELEINTDYHRGQKQSFNGSAVYDKIDIGLHNRILSFCKKNNITPYVFYMGGFNVLLSKFSGNEDIVVGMPISGRDAKYLDTIGMFVNTIALRNKPEGTKAAADFLREVKENSVNAIKYQDYPYGELVKKLNIQTQNRSPLFDVMLAYQSEQMTDVVFGDKKAELLPIPITTSKYDFTFNIMPRKNDVVIMAEYCTELYKETTVKRFILGFKQVLEQLLADNKLIENISVISPEEQQTLLYTFNDTAVEYPKDKCVHQLFEEQVERTPDKTAIIFKDTVLSYFELNELVQKYADILVSLGINKGNVVAVHLERSHRLIVLQLAVLKIGAIFLPVDKRYPIDRIEYMCKDCNVSILVSDDSDDRHIKANVITIDEFEQAVPNKKAATVNNSGISSPLRDLQKRSTAQSCSTMSASPCARMIKSPLSQRASRR